MFGLPKLPEFLKYSAAPSPAAAPEVDALTKEADKMHALKAGIIEEIRAKAGLSGQRPTLEMYRAAFNDNFAMRTHLKTLVNEGKLPSDPDSLAKKTLEISADLSGQDLSGFLLSDPRKPFAGKSATSDFMNQDSDGAVNDFYALINLKDANVKDAYVRPATSFNDQITKAKDLNGITFDGMMEGETFVFGSGQYNNVKMTNVNGGTIHFGKNSQVNKIDIDGKEAHIELGAHARVNKITVNDGFGILSLTMENGAEITHSDLSNATIGMNSVIAPGAKFKNVQFGNLNGVDLKGVIFENCEINGVPITNTEQLAKYGASVDQTTQMNVSPQILAKYDLDQKLAGIKPFSFGRSSTSPQAPAPTAPTMAQAPQEIAMMRFAVADASLASALEGFINPAKDLVGRVQPEQGMVLGAAPNRGPA